jgi:hypothetical protein
MTRRGNNNNNNNNRFETSGLPLSLLDDDDDDDFDCERSTNLRNVLESLPLSAVIRGVLSPDSVNGCHRLE